MYSVSGQQLSHGVAKDSQHSTIEPEYRLAAMAAQENIWLIQLMEDLNHSIDCCTFALWQPVNYKIGEKPSISCKDKTNKGISSFLEKECASERNNNEANHDRRAGGKHKRT